MGTVIRMQLALSPKDLVFKIMPGVSNIPDFQLLRQCNKIMEGSASGQWGVWRRPGKNGGLDGREGGGRGVYTEMRHSGIKGQDFGRRKLRKLVVGGLG